MEQPAESMEVGQNDSSPERHLAPVPWTKRDIFWATVLGVFVLLGLVMCVLVGLAIYELLTGTESSTGPLVTLVLIAELGLLLPVWAFGVHKYRLPWSSVGFRRFDLAPGCGLGCLFMLGALGCNLIWGIILGIFGREVQPDVLPLFGGGIAGLLLALFAGGVVAPIAEEAFFRGYLFAGLRKHLGLLPAMLLSAALFALVHILPTSWPPIFFLGVLFALLYEQTASIWPAVFLHGLINALGFLASYLMPMVSS